MATATKVKALVSMPGRPTLESFAPGDAQLKEWSNLLVTGGSPVRLRVLVNIYKNPDMSVTELASTLGMSLVNCSIVLRKLKGVNLINTFRQGVYVKVRLSARGRKFIRVLKTLD